MKKLVLFLSALVVLASCQKKKYASFQKSNTTTYAVTKKQTVAAQPVAEVAVAAEAPIVAAPTEATLAADNSVAVTSLNNEVVSAPVVNESQVMMFNEQAVNAEFEKLNKLEQYVTSHEGTTIEDVKNTELTENLNLDTNVANAVVAGELPLNIPAFWWGCVLGLLGVLAVYLITDKDKEQTKKALYGCLAWTVVWVVYYVVVLATF